MSSQNLHVLFKELQVSTRTTPSDNKTPFYKYIYIIYIYYYFTFMKDTLALRIIFCSPFPPFAARLSLFLLFLFTES